MGVDIAGGFARPVQDRNWLNKVLIGGVINIVPIVNFMAAGYSLEYLNDLLGDGAKGLPEWNGWGDLFMLGLKVCLLALAYFAVVMLLGILSVVMLGTIGALLTALLYLAVLFVFPVAVLRFVQSGFDLRSAFAIEAIYQLAVAKVSDYFIVYLVILVASVVIAAISSIPVIGWILGMLASFYLMLASSVLLVEVFGDEPAGVSE